MSYRRYHIWTPLKTMRYLSVSKKDFIRFGDGEIKWMNCVGSNSFEPISESLKDELMSLTNIEDQNLLFGINSRIFLKRMLFKDKKTKEYYYRFSKRFHDFLLNTFSPNHYYLEGSISWHFRETKHSKNHYKKYFNYAKRLWNNLDVLIVEGSEVRNGVGNDLFDNARSIKRIHCPQQCSFEKKDLICNSIIKAIKNYNFDIILFSIGPTSKIIIESLRHKKTKARLLDFGSFDLDYTFFINNQKTPCKINVKNVPFLDDKSGKQIVLDFDEKTYNQQVVDIIQ